MTQPRWDRSAIQVFRGELQAIRNPRRLFTEEIDTLLTRGHGCFYTSGYSILNMAYIAAGFLTEAVHIGGLTIPSIPTRAAGSPVRHRSIGCKIPVRLRPAAPRRYPFIKGGFVV